MGVRVLAPLAALVVALALPATGHAQDPPEEEQGDPSPQQLFEELLLADARTTTAVRRLLRTKAGFVAPREFADLTGDGKSDAVVAVESSGVAGAVAVFVFSAQGSSSGKLRAVFRSQSLYRARTRLRDGMLTVGSALWSRGDDACCPARISERDYAWSAKARTFVRRGSRRYDGPR
jgi:hypothetical protein